MKSGLERKKVASGGPWQVNYPARQVIFYSHFPDGLGTRSGEQVQVLVNRC